MEQKSSRNYVSIQFFERPPRKQWPTHSQYYSFGHQITRIIANLAEFFFVGLEGCIFMKFVVHF